MGVFAFGLRLVTAAVSAYNAMSAAFDAWATATETREAFAKLGFWLFLFIAMVAWAWVDEHRKVRKLKREIADLKADPGQARPLLDPYLDEVIPCRDVRNRLALLVVVNIKNMGIPTTAEHWNTFVHGPNGKRELREKHIRAPIAFLTLDRTQQVSLLPEASMLDRALQEISQTKPCRGVLLFTDGLEPLPRIGETLEITFQDGKKNPYRISETLEQRHFKHDVYANLAMDIQAVSLS
jgi:hypothetical protein